jgi:hypothetical protein
MTMLVERVAPELVGDKSTLPVRLQAEAESRGWSESRYDALLATVPAQLLACGCFLDRLTGLWRYEFGEPHKVGGQLIWGVHMWLPVPVLFDVLACAHLRLSPKKCAVYAALLTDRRKHPDFLAEMFPLLRVNPAVAAEYEVAGRGAGNTTVDWAIGPVSGRSILLDVKRRYADFFNQMEDIAASGEGSAPEHDPALLFRSIENKFLQANPDQVLQGAWIMTDIKQEASELARAFDGLDPAKVHFTILGDQQREIRLLTRRPEDRAFLLDLFDCVEDSRFEFKRPPPDQTPSSSAAAL